MLNILVIEDDVIDQLALSRLIKKNDLNCSLTIADKIEESKLLLEANNYDLVICDLNLPDGKAFDLKKYIDRQPFILLSGYLEQEIIDKSLAYGAIQVLQKSSELDQLRSILNLIQHMLEKRSSTSTVSTPPENKASDFNIHNLLTTFDQQKEPVVEILEAILTETPKMIEEIIAAIEAGDREMIKRIAHRLKSNYIMIGLREQHKIAEQIEKESVTAEFKNLQEKMLDLKEQLIPVYPELKMALSSLNNN